MDRGDKQALLEPDSTVAPNARLQEPLAIFAAPREPYVPPRILSFKLSDATAQALLQQMRDAEIAR
jgi:hypothetical protein